MEKSEQWRHEKYAVTRMKQLTKLMGRTYPEIEDLFQNIKRLQTKKEMHEALHTVFEGSKAEPHKSDLENVQDASKYYVAKV